MKKIEKGCKNYMEKIKKSLEITIKIYLLLVIMEYLLVPKKTMLFLLKEFLLLNHQ
jgi:hypothetical protein